MDEVLITTEKEPIFGMASGEAGAPLVIGIHGWSQRNGWHTWQPLMEPLAVAGYRVVCVDMPGWGRSAAWTSGSLGEAEAIEAVLAVMDGSESESAVLMGKSWGGGVAISTAVKQPERVSGLVLTAPAVRELNKVGALRQPALLAWAEDDPVIPYRYAAYLVDAAPSMELVSYPTGGHSAGPKNAEDFAPRVIRFLESAGSS